MEGGSYRLLGTSYIASSVFGVVSFNPNNAGGFEFRLAQEWILSLELIEMLRITSILILCIKFHSS